MSVESARTEEKKYEVTPEIKEAMATIARGTDTLLIESELEPEAGPRQGDRHQAALQARSGSHGT